ncbi:MAG TPA: hypothetical protein VGB71_09110 [Flavisolibacter sp.]
MEKLITLIFNPDDIQQLLNRNPEKIVVRSILEEGRLESGERVGYVRVFADAVIDGEVVDTVGGCPRPPCN